MDWSTQSYGDDDDDKSISSESSGGGNPVAMNNKPSSTREDLDIYNNQELGMTLRMLPNATQAQEMLDLQVVYENCDESTINVALLLACWNSDINFVIRLISLVGCDVNARDTMGRTPLHLASWNGCPQIVKLLLRNDAQANVWDNGLKATPLHCAASAGSVECMQLLLRNGAQINSGIERKSPLHYAVQKNHLHCVQLLLQYGANPNTPQVYTETPLHVAAASGFAECIKLLLDFGADIRSQFGRRRITALHLAAEDDYAECVKLLLDGGANINAMNADGQTPLHLACLAQAVDTVGVLIERGANVNAIYKDGRTALHAAIVKESRFWDCARMLLEAKVDVNKADNFGYTPLHIAALNEFSYCVMLLLDYGADITARTNGNVSALSFIVRRTPEVLPKYISKFDSAIKVNDHEIGDVDCEIKLDFKILVPNFERGETDLLLAFIEVGQKHVLQHPLCETFLFLKWRRIRKFFLFSLIFHSIFVLLFTLYILGVYVRDCSKEVNPLLDGLRQENDCEASKYIVPVGYTVLFLNLVLLLKEMFQMAHGFNGYLRYWENWLQLLVILGVFLCSNPEKLIGRDISMIPIWQHHVAAIVIFLVWVELMMLVGRFPIFGLYVQMFTTVAVNFSKFLMAYCCLLIAFGLSFGVLFPNYPAFEYIPWALLKTVIMMAGELEFEDIFYNGGGDDDDAKPYRIKYPVTSHIVFFGFVLLITIILTNLMVGLAVSDIQGLQVSAGLDRLSRQAELVYRLESFLFSKLLRNVPMKLLKICQRNALLRTSRYHLQFCIKPNDPREKRIPRDIIASIYKLVAERRDRNQSMRRRRKRNNFNLFNEYQDNLKDTRTYSDIELRSPSSTVRGMRHYTESENCDTLKPYVPLIHHFDPGTATAPLGPGSVTASGTIASLQKQLKLISDTQEIIMGKLALLSKEVGSLKK